VPIHPPYTIRDSTTGQFISNQAIESRFWTKIDKTPRRTGCWLWRGTFFTDGYGAFAIHGRNTRAHRFSYELHYGRLLPGFSVLHRCDVKPCVNPAHLFPGTQDDNMKDAMRKGRKPSGDQHPARRHPEKLPRGEAHGRAKLTELQVQEIRHLQGTCSQEHIAKLYGLCRATVSAIHRHRIWKHLG